MTKYKCPECETICSELIRCVQKTRCYYVSSNNPYAIDSINGEEWTETGSTEFQCPACGFRGWIIEFDNIHKDETA